MRCERIRCEAEADEESAYCVDHRQCRHCTENALPECRGLCMQHRFLPTSNEAGTAYTCFVAGSPYCQLAHDTGEKKYDRGKYEKEGLRNATINEGDHSGVDPYTQGALPEDLQFHGKEFHLDHKLELQEADFIIRLSDLPEGRETNFAIGLFQDIFNRSENLCFTTKPINKVKGEAVKWMISYAHANALEDGDTLRSFLMRYDIVGTPLEPEVADRICAVRVVAYRWLDEVLRVKEEALQQHQENTLQFRKHLQEDDQAVDYDLLKSNVDTLDEFLTSRLETVQKLRKSTQNLATTMGHVQSQAMATAAVEDGGSTSFPFASEFRDALTDLQQQSAVESTATDAHHTPLARASDADEEEKAAPGTPPSGLPRR